MGRAVGITWLVTAIGFWIFQRLAFRFQWLDQPGGRKTHASPTPVIGGLAIGLGHAMGFMVMPVHFWSEPVQIYCASMMLLLIAGFLDDLWDTSFRWRLFIQMVLVFIWCTWGGLVVHDLGSLWGKNSVQLGILAVPFTVFAVVGVINAINLLDGLDGLAGGVVFLATVGFILIAHRLNANLELHLLSMLLAALTVFLFFNVRWRKRPARVFMGDAGSLLLGGAMAWFAIRLTQVPYSNLMSVGRASPLVALLLLAIPVANALVVVIRRIQQGQSPFLPTRDHVHDRLMARGWGVTRTVLFFWALQAVLVAIAYGGGLCYSWPDVVLFACFLLILTVFFCMNRFEIQVK